MSIYQAQVWIEDGEDGNLKIYVHKFQSSITTAISTKNQIISDTELSELLGFLEQIKILKYCLIKKPILFPKIYYGSDLE